MANHNMLGVPIKKPEAAQKSVEFRDGKIDLKAGEMFVITFSLGRTYRSLLIFKI